MLCALGAAPGWLLLGPSLCTQIPGSRAVQELGAVRGAEHISLRASRPARSSPSLRVLQLTDSCVCCPASLQSSPVLAVPALCCALDGAVEEQWLWLQPLLAARCAVRLLSLKQTFVWVPCWASCQ